MRSFAEWNSSCEVMPSCSSKSGSTTQIHIYSKLDSSKIAIKQATKHLNNKCRKHLWQFYFVLISVFIKTEGNEYAAMYA